MWNYIKLWNYLKLPWSLNNPQIVKLLENFHFSIIWLGLFMFWFGLLCYDFASFGVCPCCLNFAESGLRHSKLNDLLKVRNRAHTMKVRNWEKYQVQFSNTERWRRSSVIYMHSLLNETWRNICVLWIIVDKFSTCQLISLSIVSYSSLFYKANFYWLVLKNNPFFIN